MCAVIILHQKHTPSSQKRGAVREPPPGGAAAVSGFHGDTICLLLLDKSVHLVSDRDGMLFVSGCKSTTHNNPVYDVTWASTYRKWVLFE